MKLHQFRKPPVPQTLASAEVSPQRDLSQEPVLNLEAIQSDLLLGHSKKAEAHIYFKITNRAAFVEFLTGLPITSAAAVYRQPGARVAHCTGAPPPNPRVAVGFTRAGLAALGRDPGNSSDLAVFTENMHGRAVAELNDPPPETWVIGRPDEQIDGVFIITGAQESDVSGALDDSFADPNAEGFQIHQILLGKTRPGDAEGHEHFGFLDGVSQPGIRGCVDAEQTVPLTATSNPNEPDQGLPGQDLLWPGEFVFGYYAQKDGAARFTERGDIRTPPIDWMKDGAFLVVRRLIQLVPEMHAGAAAVTPPGQRREQLEAQLVGRWPNGAPVVTNPNADDPALGTDENRNNDFEFGGDRLGLVCPWAAHIRKAYPRDDVRGIVNPDEPTTDQAEAGTQRHRMLRRGIQFGEEVTEQERQTKQTEEQRGLLFRCYITDIARQFEFVQKNWCNNTDFVQSAAGHDPIIGQVAGGSVRTFAGVGYAGLKPTFDFKPWVTMTGGVYLFAPSLDFINSLNAVS